MRPADALDRIVYLLDRDLAESQKVRAFARARDVVEEVGDDEVERLHAHGDLTDLPGIGPTTARVIAEALDGGVPSYVAELEVRTQIPAEDGAGVRAALRGDCHTHSTWSDGGASIEKMARTAMVLGHEYMVLTDHSPRLTVAHGLSADRLRRQLDEIEALNERLAPFRILHGIEVNIRADGSLDVDADVLAGLDWVMASLHSAFDRDPTGRILKAMESPHVDCIGHPTARKINKRPPADVDIERLIDKALGTGTFLEINAQPDRLDLRDVHARTVAEAGVPVAVSSDAHSTRALGYAELGLAQARRAWLTRDQV
ncbi:MAG TPA: PHP domain-containing protein, partial [Acidimicrobiales bacterium]